MKVVLALERCSRPDVLEAQVAFHLAAGVDHVIVDGLRVELDEMHALEPFIEWGLASAAVTGGASTPTSAGPLLSALGEGEVSWVLKAGDGEFWWPRYGSFEDVLALVPERFGVVQAAVHDVVRRLDDGHFAEAAVHRLARRPGARITWLTRVTSAGSVSDAERRAVPVLRGWFPFEVLRIGVPQPPPTHLALTETVPDTRVRDALRAIAGVARLEPHVTFPLERVLRRELVASVTPDLASDALLACELQEAVHADVPALIDDRVLQLDRRVRALEEGLSSAIRRRWPRRRSPTTNGLSK